MAPTASHSETVYYKLDWLVYTTTVSSMLLFLCS